MKPLRIAAVFCLTATTVALLTPAPAHAQRLAGISNPNSSSAKASAKKQGSLNGFQDIKWGESVEKATKTLEAKGATVTKDSGSDVNAKTVLTVSNLKVADYDTHDITLRFGSEGFYQANILFPHALDSSKLFDDMRLIITERFGDATPDRSSGGLGGGGFGGGGGLGGVGLQWLFDQSTGEPASLKLQNQSRNQLLLEYRATNRADREEARIRSERAKSL